MRQDKNCIERINRETGFVQWRYSSQSCHFYGDLLSVTWLFLADLSTWNFHVESEEKYPVMTGAVTGIAIRLLDGAVISGSGQSVT
jgi:hypothetical protein